MLILVDRESAPQVLPITFLLHISSAARIIGGDLVFFLLALSVIIPRLSQASWLVSTFHNALFGESRPSNKRHPDLTSSTVHKAALACVPRGSATPISDTCLIAPVASGQKVITVFLR